MPWVLLTYAGRSRFVWLPAAFDVQAKADGASACRGDSCCQELSRVARLREGFMLATAFELR